MPHAEQQHGTYDAQAIEDIRRRNIAWARCCNEDSIRAQRGLAALRERLLALGGEEVGFYAFEPYLTILIERGTSFGKYSRVRRGIPHRSYHNAAELWHTSGGQTK